MRIGNEDVDQKLVAVVMNEVRGMRQESLVLLLSETLQWMAKLVFTVRRVPEM